MSGQRISELPALAAASASNAAHLLPVLTGSLPLTTESIRFDVLEGALLRLLNIFDPMDPVYGAKADGSDDHVAIGLAEAAAFAVGGMLLFRPGKNFDIGTTGLTIRCGIAQGSERATITYHGTGTAVTFGNTTSGQLLQYATAHFPQIVQANKAVTGWAQAGGADAGLKIINVYRSQLFVTHVQNFSVGLLLFGLGTGVSYNTFHMGQIDNNKVTVDFDADATGWANENVFIAGSLSFLSAEGANVSGTRFMRLKATTNAVNNNRFIGVAMEGTTPEYYVECHGQDNYWIGCRWEASSTAKVNFDGAGAVRNALIHGYQLTNVTITQTNGATKNMLQTTDLVRMAGSAGAPGVMTLENISSSAQPVLSTVAAGADQFADPSAAYGMQISHNSTKFKGTGDAQARVQVDGSSGKVLFTDGTVAPSTEYFRGFGTDGIQHVGTKLAFFSTTPAARGTLPAAAVDAATTQALANAIRTALLNLGLSF